PDVRAYRVRDLECESLPVIVDPPQPGVFASLRNYMRGRFNWVSSRAPKSRAPVGTYGSSQVDAADGASGALHEQRTAIGILGGMGPAATVDLYGKIVQRTPAESDQEHIPVYVYADPRVPDRTDALLNDGQDPTPWLVRGARRLSEMGADFIIIPCNTAHAFLDRIEGEVSIDILSMIDAAADTVVEAYPDTRTVGLLATTGTIRSGIYQEALRRRGIATIVPDEEMQRHDIMPSIRAVKANRRDPSVTRRLADAADSMAARGAHVILAACTEIPVVLHSDDLTTPLVDATEALAQRAVREAQRRDRTRNQEAGDRVTAKTG
ncbi:MAG: aspartate/glutamate racemase family protein, partial [Chloroflexota bacterium]